MATKEELLAAFMNNPASLVVNREEKMQRTMDKIIENQEQKVYLHNKAVDDGVKQGQHLSIAEQMGYGLGKGNRTGD